MGHFSEVSIQESESNKKNRKKSKKVVSKNDIIKQLCLQEPSNYNRIEELYQKSEEELRIEKERLDLRLARSRFERTRKGRVEYSSSNEYNDITESNGFGRH